MQVYNLGIDDKTKSNEATVTYQIRDTATTRWFLRSRGVEGPESTQRPVDEWRKACQWQALQPGKYKVTIKINDTISKQEIAQSAPFVVE
jgi:hypothetical protein